MHSIHCHLAVAGFEFSFPFDHKTQSHSLQAPKVWVPNTHVLHNAVCDWGDSRFNGPTFRLDEKRKTRWFCQTLWLHKRKKFSRKDNESQRDAKQSSCCDAVFKSITSYQRKILNHTRTERKRNRKVLETNYFAKLSTLFIFTSIWSDPPKKTQKQLYKFSQLDVPRT